MGNVDEDIKETLNTVLPADCHLFHGTKYSTLESMITKNKGLLPVNVLKKEKIEIQSGLIMDKISNDPKYVDPVNNGDSISTVKRNEFGLAHNYAITSNSYSKINDNFPVIFGLKIELTNNDVKKTQITDGFYEGRGSRGYTDYSVQRVIEQKEIGMIMVPDDKVFEIEGRLQGTELENVPVRSIESLFSIVDEEWSESYWRKSISLTED